MRADTVGDSATRLAGAGLPRGRRMLRPAEFAAVQAATRLNSMRTHSEWLAMTACWTPSGHPAARLGLVVSKKMARRAIDRALVKRIVREAFRHRATELEHLAARASVRADLSVRLRSAVPPPGTRERLSQGALRNELRAAADELMSSLLVRLQQIPDA